VLHFFFFFFFFFFLLVECERRYVNFFLLVKCERRCLGFLLPLSDLSAWIFFFWGGGSLSTRIGDLFPCRVGPSGVASFFFLLDADASG